MPNAANVLAALRLAECASPAIVRTDPPGGAFHRSGRTARHKFPRRVVVWTSHNADTVATKAVPALDKRSDAPGFSTRRILCSASRGISSVLVSAAALNGVMNAGYPLPISARPMSTRMI
jgi:hypothetical protein